jgi:2-phosphosulfolactate phosphatase
MKVKLYFTPAPLTEAKVRGKVTIVVDVLRASTTICTAIQNGCREIIPVGTVGDAAAIRANLDRDSVLVCGEREGLKIEGFDLGNSPAEYSEQIVRNKVLVFASTNGSRAILKCAPSAVTFVGGFVNLGAIVATAAKFDKDVAIVCAGKQGNFSLEDTFCGGAIIERLLQAGNYDVSNDAAQVALMLYKNQGQSVEAVIRQADHARYLIGLGFESDIATAAALDTINVVPVLSGNKIVDAQKHKLEGTI